MTAITAFSFYLSKKEKICAISHVCGAGNHLEYSSASNSVHGDSKRQYNVHFVDGLSLQTYKLLPPNAFL